MTDPSQSAFKPIRAADSSQSAWAHAGQPFHRSRLGLEALGLVCGPDREGYVRPAHADLLCTAWLEEANGHEWSLGPAARSFPAAIACV